MRLVTLLVLTLTILGAGICWGKQPHFDARRVGVTSNRSLQAFIGGSPLRARFGPNALGRRTRRLASKIHRLMPDGAARYDKVLVTPTQVALVHRSGVVDLVRRVDAKQQISTGQTQTTDRLEVGRGPRGYLWAQKGPADTVLLYRQLPTVAKGQVASTDVNTSFALGKEDAFHPFGKAGKTVRLAVPMKTFKRAVDGTAGAVGWNAFGDGYSTGLEVLKEVQLPSSSVRDLLR